MTIYIRYSVILVFIFLAKLISAQHADTRVLCIKALYQIKDSVDQVIRTNSYFKEKLDFGVVDEESLMVEFEYLPAKERGPQKAGFFQGIRFDFIHPIDRPVAGFGRTFEWHYLDVQLRWRWSWPMIKFDTEHQKVIMNKVREAGRLLADHEQHEVNKLGLSEDEKGRVIEGKNKIKLELRPRPDTLSAYVDLYAISRTSKPVFLSNEILHALIIDDSIYNLHIPNSFIAYMGNTGLAAPFVEIKKKDPVFVRSIALPRLSPGSHMLRVITSFNTDSWVDKRPTLLDGQPIIRTLENAWVGRAFSNSIQVEINGQGLIVLPNSRSIGN